MRSLQFIFTTLITFLFVTGAFFWRKAIAVLLCGVLSFNSTSCYSFLSNDGKADAAQPSIPVFTTSAKQLDANHNEIRLTFPKGCEFISHLTRTPEGIFQDTLQYSHSNLQACGVKPFTVHYSNAGKTAEIQIQGQSDRLRLDASADKGIIQQTYQDASGKVQQEEVPIPKEVIDYLKNSQRKPLVQGESSALPDSRNLQPKQNIQEPWLVASSNVESIYPPDSVAFIWDDAADLPTACKWAKFGDHACNYMAMLTGITGIIGLMGKALHFIPYLGMASLATETLCWSLYGGVPPILNARQILLEKQLLNRSVNELNELTAAVKKPQIERGLGGLIKDNPGYQTYINNVERIVNAKLPPNITNGGAVVGAAEGFDAYLDESKKQGVFQNIFNTGVLSNFVDSEECNPKPNGTSVQKPSGTLVQAKSHGDPHLVTFDGLKYDLQTLGETILIKSNNGDFEVQARQEPFSPSLSVNSAVAMQVGRNRVALTPESFLMLIPAHHCE